MNKRKFLSIITIIALVITTVVPAFGAGGDNTGSTEWPANINISESTLETTSYHLGDVKEFQIGYYPANTSGAVLEAIRHIEITGQAQVSGFEFSEDGSTWKDIGAFEGNIKITTTTIHRVRATFNEAGEYTIRLWMTNDQGEIVKESKKEIYVSEEGIYVKPSAPTDLKETSDKFVFEWQYNANKEVKYNFYIDGEKINAEEIALKQYDASEYGDKFTPGVHTISVTSVLVKDKKVMSAVESAPITMEYIVEEPETETESVVETESESESESVIETESESESESVVETESESESESVVETESESESESVVETESESESESVVETESESTTEGKETGQAVTTAPVKSTAAVTQKLKLTQGKITKASKKAAAKKVKITFKKIKKATSYEVQICRNKKFKKKKTITKVVKKNKCTFKKLKPNKKYYVRVRAVAKSNGKTVRGKWSNKRRIKLKK